MKIKSYKHCDLYLHENQCHLDRTFVQLFVGSAHGLSGKFMASLIHEISKTLCKDIRKRKTTQSYLEQSISFEDLYIQFIKNKYVIAA